MASPQRSTSSVISGGTSRPVSEGLPGTGSSSSLSSKTDSSKARPLSDVRLFIANLAPSVSEHDLLSACKLHGTLRKLDLVFHRSGPQRGQHKGYAFVEYASATEAARARMALDGKPLRGREMHVNYATLHADHDLSGRGPQRRIKPNEDPSKPTLLSLSKNLNRKDSTSSRIAAMEAKLEAIRNRKPTTATQGPSADPKGLPPRPGHLPPKPHG